MLIGVYYAVEPFWLRRLFNAGHSALGSGALCAESSSVPVELQDLWGLY